MPRLSRFQIMEQMKPQIVEYFEEKNQRIFSVQDMYEILNSYKEKWTLPAVTKGNDFIKFLTENNILEQIEIQTPQRKITKFKFNGASVYELAVSINGNSYLSHYTALFLHGLTNNIPKNIYTNTEQAPKYVFYKDDIELEQENIDWAFARPMRITKQIAKFEIDNKKYQVYLLNGKHQKRLGVSKVSINGIELPITSLERTLIDIVVRPNYSGGIEEVIHAYKIAKSSFSVNRLLVLLDKMNYVYPYHQLIGFYLEKAGYDENVLKLIELNAIEYNLYLTYEIKEKNFSERWRVYYPRYLDH
ncbi:hypothetical protein CN507_18480 [Bacillus cereus]|uniref:type IV toxin-antitoxin system AbiEi family antitoxin domain-containing protein n=1 Tax=Bacillus cereus group TaxID=86661 RepID=UPI000BF3CEA4|nr:MULTISPECIES: hypothetical protein [Bacillus cereus group]PES64904.1 hypothetical protein CN507_18480 [Bacillus cereus]PGB10509.1 hypothetical protein COM09_22740 [Bacillus toyonensis]UYX52287.1 hypothetical protein M3Y14_28115 [Bacillus thuringiensis]